MEVIYHNVIKRIGANVSNLLKEEMIILFSDAAPNDLKDFCYIIDISPVEREIKPGNSMYIDNEKFNITAVGKIVKQNLERLGHITLRFDGSTTPELPGSLYLERKEIPQLNVGTEIKIIAG